MVKKKAYVVLIIILGVFIYLLWSFFRTSYQIQQSVHNMDLRYQQPSADQQHIVLISQELDNPYWRSIEKGARNAADKWDMQMEYIGPIRINPDEQIRYLEKAIASKVDGIIVQGSRDPKLLSLLTKAKQKHIPILTIDTDAPNSERLAYVGTDNFTSGKLLGEYVANRMSGKGTIGVIMGSRSADNHKLRVKGFLESIKSYPKLSVKSVEESNISQIQASQMAEKMMRTYPDINVMVGTSALDGLGIIQAAENIGRESIHIYGFDNLKETKQAIQTGKMEATLEQEPAMMGYKSVQLLHQFFTGHSVKTQYFTPIDVLDEEDVK